MGTTSYTPPGVGAYSGPGAIDALTSGGQNVVLRGANFGPVGGAQVTATYGKSNDTVVFSASGCFVSQAHSEITCQTAPGAGDQLDWTVVVDGQTSVAQLSDYAPPVVDAVTLLATGAVPPSNASDAGGQLVRLDGANFGPPVPGYLEQVAYGPPSFPSLFDATAGCVVQSHRRMQCATVAGSGVGLVWTVRVRGQSFTSATVAAGGSPSVSLSYVGLDIRNTSCATGRTLANACVAYLRPGSFAMCDVQAVVSVLFGTKTVTPSGVLVDTGGGNWVPFVRASHCAVGSGALAYPRALAFTTPQMTDPVATVAVRVQLVSPATVDSGALVSPSSVPFSYLPPVSFALYVDPAPVGAPGSLAVSVVGDNFCASEACCQTYLDGSLASTFVTLHSDVRVTVTARDAGTVQIRCPTGSTGVLTFATRNPFVFGAVRVDTGVDVGSTVFDTRGYSAGATPNEEIYVFGTYFGTGATVTIRSVVATVAEEIAFACDSPPVGVALPGTAVGGQISGETCTRLRVRVPAGEGTNAPIVVSTGSSLSSLADDARYEFLTYAAPVVTALGPEFAAGAAGDGRFPTSGSGSTVLTVTGVNFGVTPGVIEFGAEVFPITCDASSPGFFWTHTSVGCNVPPGSGVNLAVTVRTATSVPGGSRASNAVLGLSYGDASVTGWSVPQATLYGPDTQGGQTLVVVGANFGRPYFADPLLPTKGPSPAVTVGGRACAVVQSSFTSISCTLPMGEGVGYAVRVTVAGVTVQAPVLFGYGAPALVAVSPRSGPTNAIDVNTNTQIVLNVTGFNFGFDELQLWFVTTAGQRIALGQRSSRLGVNTFLAGTSHTVMRVLLPPGLGSGLTLSCVVAGQPSGPSPTFSYDPPVVGSVVLTSGGGSGVSLVGGSGRRLDGGGVSVAPGTVVTLPTRLSASVDAWATNGTLGPCTAEFVDGAVSYTHLRAHET